MNGYFNEPRGVAVDVAGNVYITDRYNHRVQKFNSTGGFITTWGDSGVADGQFDQPWGIAVDSDSGFVYVADSHNDRVQKFDTNGGFLGKWGSSGPGNGQFTYPTGVAIDPNHVVYVSELGSRVQRFDSDGNFIDSFGSFGFSEGFFYDPIGLAVNDSCQVYVADSGNNRVQRFGIASPSLAPPFLLKWGIFGDLPGQLNRPYQLDVEPWYVYVADAFNDRVQKFDSHGTFLMEWGSFGTGNGQFDEVLGVALDGMGHIFVSDNVNQRIQKFDTDGNFIYAWGDSGSGPGQFRFPRGLACDSFGNVFVAGNLNDRVQKFDNNGGFLLLFGSTGNGPGKFHYPRALCVDSNDDVWVADGGNNRVQKFDNMGGYLDRFGSLGDGPGQFDSPRDVAVDAQGFVYVTDEFNHRIQKFDGAGNFIAAWGSHGSGDGQFRNPYGVVADSCGRVYIGDRENFRIQQFGDPAHCGPNTPTGVSVQVQFPGNFSTTFASVSVEGFTEVATQASGPAPPGGILPVPSSTPVYYDITTDAVYSGPIEIVLSYDPASVQGAEDDLDVLHWDETLSPPSWRAVTTSVDTNANLIFAEANSLSLFLIVEPGSPTGVKDRLIPAAFRIYQNFPNPFYASTLIRYDLPEPGPVKLQVFDLQGKLVRTLVDRDEDPGRYSLHWNGENDAGRAISPGVYFYRLETRQNTVTQKLIKIP